MPWKQRNSVSTATGYTPFQLMFGRDPIEDLDVLFPSPARKRELLSVSEYSQQLATRIEQAYHLARVHMGMAVARQRRHYQRQPKFFQIEDMVWLFTPTLGARGSTKMSSNWSGPWEVTTRVNDLMYIIRAKYEMKINKTATVAIDRLRLYNQGQDEPLPLTKEGTEGK